MTEPTLDYITKLKTDLIRRFGRRNDFIENWRLLRLRLKDVSSRIPEEYRVSAVEYRTPEIQASGQVQANILATSDVIAHIPPPKNRHRDLTTKGERWLNWGHDELESENSVDAKVVDTQVFYGPGVYKLYPRPHEERWPDYPLRGKDEDAAKFNDRTETFKAGQSQGAVFHYSFVPLEIFYWREDARGMSEAMEIKVVELGQLLPDWRQEVEKAGLQVDKASDLARKMTVIEYWSRSHRVIVVEGSDDTKRIKRKFDVWEHNFGQTPYFVAETDQTSDTDPEHRYMPLVWAMYAEAERNNSLHTMLSNVAYRMGWPYYYIETATGEGLVMDTEKGVPKTFAFVPGQPPQLLPGQKIVKVDFESGADLRQQAAESDLRLRSYAAPEILQAHSPGADFPGVGLTTLQRLGVARLDSLSKGRAKAMRQMYRFMLWSVKHYIKETVYASAYEEKATARTEPLGLSPDDIVTLNVGVKVQPDLPMDRMALEKHGMELLLAQKISEITYQEQYRGIETPEEELADIFSDKGIAQQDVRLLQQIDEQLTGADAAARLLAGETAVSIDNGIRAEQGALGKGSPGQPRRPGVRMPTSTPIGQSPTTSGPAGPPPVPIPGGI